MNRRAGPNQTGFVKSDYDALDVLRIVMSLHWQPRTAVRVAYLVEEEVGKSRYLYRVRRVVLRLNFDIREVWISACGLWQGWTKRSLNAVAFKGCWPRTANWIKLNSNVKYHTLYLSANQIKIKHHASSNASV